MKILFWLSIGLDHRTPSEHLLTAIIDALYKKGHTVHILQKDTGGGVRELYPKLQELGVTTTKIEMNAVEHSNLVSRYLADIRYVEKCSNWMKKHTSFDRVFLQSSNVAGFQMKVLQKRMSNTPVIFNIQDLFPENAVYSGKITPGSIPYKFFSWTQKYAYKKADAIVTISEDIKDELKSIGVDEGKVEVVYNWSYQDKPFDLGLSTNKEIRRMLPQETFNVVYAGNIGVMQNVEVVIEAARHSKDANIVFHVFGDGTYKQKLIEKAKNLNNVRFWPMQPVEKAPILYSCADVNIIPLAENIYRTALPSKTATCLAVHTPIVFCIGEKSKFARHANEATGCPSVGCNDPEGLLTAINNIRNKKIIINTEKFFSENMGITKNSMRYATIIEKGTI